VIYPVVILLPLAVEAVVVIVAVVEDPHLLEV
jgi:hypothetical protein